MTKREKGLIAIIVVLTVAPVKLQMGGWPGTTAGCVVLAQDYSRARLWLDGR